MHTQYTLTLEDTIGLREALLGQALIRPQFLNDKNWKLLAYDDSQWIEFFANRILDRAEQYSIGRLFAIGSHPVLESLQSDATVLSSRSEIFEYYRSEDEHLAWRDQLVFSLPLSFLVLCCPGLDYTLLAGPKELLEDISGEEFGHDKTVAIGNVWSQTVLDYLYHPRHENQSAIDLSIVHSLYSD